MHEVETKKMTWFYSSDFSLAFVPSLDWIYIKHSRQCRFITLPNTKKFVKNTLLRVACFHSLFRLLGNMVKHCLDENFNPDWKNKCQMVNRNCNISFHQHFKDSIGKNVPYNWGSPNMLLQPQISFQKELCQIIIECIFIILFFCFLCSPKEEEKTHS